MFNTCICTHTLEPFKDSGPDSQKVKKLAFKLQFHSVDNVTTLVFELVCSFKMWDTCVSDHAALSTEFRVNAVGGESANTKHHVCRIGQCVNNLVLRWQHEKAHVYARHISENMELLAQFDEAERELSMWINWHSVCVR